MRKYITSRIVSSAAGEFFSKTGTEASIFAVSRRSALPWPYSLKPLVSIGFPLFSLMFHNFLNISRMPETLGALNGFLGYWQYVWHPGWVRLDEHFVFEKIIDTNNFRPKKSQRFPDLQLWSSPKRVELLLRWATKLKTLWSRWVARYVK